jgi:regulator of sirC expression with transglutaminase-like and TPR domain
MSGNNKISELEALISMLDEPSESVFIKVREKILDYGMKAVPHLKNSWDNSFDDSLQKRITEIIQSIRQTDLIAGLINWRNSEKLNLLKGYYLASRYINADLDLAVIEAKIDRITRDIWVELNDKLTALEKIRVMNHVVFESYGFTGKIENPELPESFSISHILDSHKGNHLTLGILTIILAQKLEIPVYGVDLPQHFILCYTDEVRDEKVAVHNESEILFYINPYNQGAVFTRREIEVFIKHQKLQPSPSYYKPCDNLAILRRLFSSIIIACKKLGQADRVREIKKISDLLK